MTRFLPLLLGVLSLAFTCRPTWRVPEMTAEELRLLPDHSALSNPADILREYDARHQRLKDLQGPVGIYMESARGSGKLDGALVLRWPDAMRMKGFRGGSTTFLDMQVDAQGAILYLPEDEKAYVAKPDQPIRMGESELRLTARQFLAGLSGAGETDATREVLDLGYAWQIQHIREGRVLRKTYLNPDTLFASVTVFFDEDGRSVLEASYLEYRLINGEWFPRVLEIQEAAGSFFLSLFLREPEINQGLVDEAFELRNLIPDDVEIIRKKE